MNQLPNPNLSWPIPLEGVLLIAEMEGLRLKAYQCQAGVWTCGWGETSGVTARTEWTKEYSDQRLLDSLNERVALVLQACSVEPSPYQLAALVSFAYNYGRWAESTVVKCHNRGDFQAAARAFDLVNKYTDPVTKQLMVSNGLTARRKREAELYMRPAEGVHRMPQEVAAESSMAASPIARSGTIAIGTGIVGMFSEFSNFSHQAKTIVVENLGLPSNLIVPCILIGIGGVVIWNRLKQRKTGWA